MSRLQLALNVDDLETSIAFYSALFGTEPHKVRPGYANFAVSEPPLKLVLVENPGQGGSVNHLGVEVADIDTVDAELTRLAAAGFATTEERDTVCCYAKQDKFWVQGTPNGEQWEVYTITDDAPATNTSGDAADPRCARPAAPEPAGRPGAGHTAADSREHHPSH